MSKKLRFTHPCLEAATLAVNDLNDRISGGHIFKASAELVNPDELFGNPERIYVKNPDSPNLPLAAPLYLAVDVAVEPGCDCESCACPCPPTGVINVTQTVWDDPAGEIWRRLGTVTPVEGQEPQVQWGQWIQLGATGGGTCDCQRRRLTGPIEFYIRKDGNDDTGDGLSEASALATWDGFYNRYIVGPDYFDANRQIVTINFGPGVWDSGTSICNIPGAGRVNIVGAGIDQTFFSNPTGYALSINENVPYHTYLRNFTVSNYTNGLNITQWVAIRVIKFTRPAVTTAYAIYVSTSRGCLAADSGGGTANIYVENFNGRCILGLANCSTVTMSNLKVVLTGTCAWVTAFAYVVRHSQIWLTNFSFSGTATGPRYHLLNFGMITVYGGGTANSLPGNQAGVVGSGCFYNYS